MRFGAHNLQFKSNFRDLFTYRPAKYTALPVQHTTTLKKHFGCLIFGARISDMLSKYGKAPSSGVATPGSIQA